MTYYVPQNVSDALLKHATRAMRATSKAEYRNGLKLLLAGVFSALPKDDRYAFLQAVDPEAEGGFLTFKKRWPDLDDPTLEAAGRSWGAVAASIRGNEANDFEKGFVRNIEAMLNRWGKPTEKQIPIMKRMYLDWKQSKDLETVSVVEDAE